MMPPALDAALRQPDDDLGGAPLSPEETVLLLHRIRTGDDAALDVLLARILPRLRRWAHGRLPRAARPMLETADIVYAVVAKAARQFARLEVQRSAALGSYLRTAIRNEIGLQWRRVGQTPERVSLHEFLRDPTLSPLEALIGAEQLEQYERALERLDEDERDAIIGRFEFAYRYDELARYLGKGTSEAARLAVYRAVKRLAELIRRG